MPDKEKVIKGLEICTKDIPMSNAVHKDDLCKECPYYNAEYSYCFNQMVMMRDALALLKEQQNQIWELQDQVEYLTDKQKEQEKKGKNRLPYSPDSNVQWT